MIILLLFYYEVIRLIGCVRNMDMVICYLGGLLLCRWFVGFIDRFLMGSNWKICNCRVIVKNCINYTLITLIYFINLC
jgi:hypothetical protein